MTLPRKAAHTRSSNINLTCLFPPRGLHIDAGIGATLTPSCSRTSAAPARICHMVTVYHARARAGARRVTITLHIPRSLDLKSPRLPEEGGSLCQGGGGGGHKRNKRHKRQQHTAKFVPLRRQRHTARHFNLTGTSCGNSRDPTLQRVQQTCRSDGFSAT